MPAATLAEFVEGLAGRHGERTAFLDTGVRPPRPVSYRELAESARAAAAYLAALGLGRGDKLVLWLPNCPAWFALHLGAARLGACTIALNTRFRAAELAAVLRAARPQAIALLPRFLEIDFAGMLDEVRAGVPSLRHAIALELQADGTIALPATPLAGAAPQTLGEPADPAIVFPTSGASGTPKLPVHEQSALIRHALADARSFEFGHGDALLGYLPFCGVFGYCATLAGLAAGASCIVERVFRIGEAVGLMREHAVTHVFGSDVFLDMLLAEPAVDDGRLGRLRSGGVADFAGKLPAMMAESERRLGVRFTGVYGSSECFALMSRWPASLDAVERARGGGTLVDPSLEVRVADPATQHIQPSGEPGELQFRGYNVLHSYLNAPEATAAAFTADGWFKSGDMGYLTGERSFVFLGRLGDALRLGGYLVDPREIEEFLVAQPHVALAQVVGAPGPRGDLPVAFVQPDDPTLLEVDVLLDACRRSIAAYKVPHAIWVVDRFPTTPSPNGEKIQKAKLRQLAAERLSAGSTR